MKTQHQPKTVAPEQSVFGAEKIAQQLKSNTDSMVLDEDISFDTHWSESYIMDYIWSHENVKKRKS
jgi:hypothetical protein